MTYPEVIAAIAAKLPDGARASINPNAVIYNDQVQIDWWGHLVSADQDRVVCETFPTMEAAYTEIMSHLDPTPTDLDAVKIEEVDATNPVRE